MSEHDTDTTDAEDEPTIELADPDDYHRTQRLKEIHKARQRVHSVIDQFEAAGRRQEQLHQRRKLAHAVSLYVSELEPLITDLDADVSLPDHWPHNDILQYADSLGRVPRDFTHEKLPDDMVYTPKPNSVQVFRQCNRVLADVKPLIEEDETNEWEV